MMHFGLTEKDGIQLISADKFSLSLPFCGLIETHFALSYEEYKKAAHNTVRYIEEIQSKSEQLTKLQNGLILVLADMVESRDQFTGDHVRKTAAYTDIMKTQALKAALKKYGFTAAFGGGRRDEEKSRAKERIFSFRNEAQAWDPKNQRPEMWQLYNTRLHKGESIRVFPISNWTEKDIWEYIRREHIEIVDLYFAKERPVVYRDGNIIMVDDDRMRLNPGEKPEMKKIRFRTLGCYPLTGGIESDADTLDKIIDETLAAVESERTSRVIDHEETGSMERRKKEGYF